MFHIYVLLFVIYPQYHIHKICQITLLFLMYLLIALERFFCKL